MASGFIIFLEGPGNLILSLLSIITSCIVIYMYRSLRQKSVVFKLIFSICFFDIVLELSNALITFIPQSYFSNLVLGISTTVFLLASSLTSVTLAKICYQSTIQENYDPNKTFARSLIITLSALMIYAIYPVFDLAIVRYNFEVSVEIIKRDSLISCILAYFYVNIPFTISPVLTSYYYFKMFKNVKESMDSEQWNEFKSRMRYILLIIVWQILFVTPLTISNNYGLAKIPIPEWLVFADYFTTRLPGVMNSLLYLLIRTKKPSVMKSTKNITERLISPSFATIEVTKSRLNSEIQNL